jgi:hypothetical protein
LPYEQGHLDDEEDHQAADDMALAKFTLHLVSIGKNGGFDKGLRKTRTIVQSARRHVY